MSLPHPPPDISSSAISRPFHLRSADGPFLGDPRLRSHRPGSREPARIVFAKGSHASDGAMSPQAREKGRAADGFRSRRGCLAVGACAVGECPEYRAARFSGRNRVPGAKQPCTALRLRALQGFRPPKSVQHRIFRATSSSESGDAMMQRHSLVATGPSALRATIPPGSRRSDVPGRRARSTDRARRYFVVACDTALWLRHLGKVGRHGSWHRNDRGRPIRSWGYFSGISLDTLKNYSENQNRIGVYLDGNLLDSLLEKAGQQGMVASRASRGGPHCSCCRRVGRLMRSISSAEGGAL